MRYRFLSRVTLIVDDTVLVQCRNPKSLLCILSLCGLPSLLAPGSWVIHFSSEKELGRALSRMRDWGVAFEAGKEWCPSEVFEELREKEIISGEYLMIASSVAGGPFVSRR